MQGKQRPDTKRSNAMVLGSQFCVLIKSELTVSVPVMDYQFGAYCLVLMLSQAGIDNIQLVPLHSDILFLHGKIRVPNN
jgi:hypothetical protein